MPSPSPRYANDPALVALGAAIHRVRLEQGMSQEELAHQSGIDRGYMSSIERRQQNPGVALVLGIARVLRLTAVQLLVVVQL